VEKPTLKRAPVHPELRNAFRFIPSFPLHRSWFVRLANWLLVHAPRRNSIGDVAISDERLTHGIVRIYRPSGSLSGAGLLWIHGGGMVLGSAAMDDRLCATYARDLKLVVISVEYRLAPQHPYPAAIDDCFEAWRWFVDSASRLGVDPNRIIVSGQSAGGGLAACLAQRLLDHGGAQPAGLALLCPMLDDRPAARKELDLLAHRVWNNRSNRAGWSAYLPHAPGSRGMPPYAVASRRLDLRGLPPTWISVSDIDLLFDENCSYWQRLTLEGVASSLCVIPQAPHGFEALLPRSRLARALFSANQLFLRENLQLMAADELATSQQMRRSSTNQLFL
jgi:acetyl esterase/lipase